MALFQMANQLITLKATYYIRNHLNIKRFFLKQLQDL